jgi:hypothetical protein
MEAEISLWNTLDKECDYKNYSRKKATFSEDGILINEIIFDSAAKGTQTLIVYAGITIEDGGVELCELDQSLNLFKGICVRFAPGSIKLNMVVMKNRENLRKMYAEKQDSSSICEKIRRFFERLFP